MRERIALVVGDKFVKFAAGKDVITYSQLRRLLSGEVQPMPGLGRLLLVPGQGLGDDMVDDLLDLASRSADRARYDFGPWHQRPRRAPAHLSHKHNPHNTLISEPRRVAEDVYEMDLMIDERGELMLDHQSGQHVQGMILIEASRQGPMAVTEAFFLPQDGRKFAFVFNEMNIRYNRFAFPLDARLRYTIREKEIRANKRFRFVGDLVIEQCGVAAASFSFAFSVVEEAPISRQEGALALETLQGTLAEAMREQPGVAAA